MVPGKIRWLLTVLDEPYTCRLLLYNERNTVKRKLAIVIGSLLISNCAAGGMHHLGSRTLPDHQEITSYEFRTHGEGTEVAAILIFACSPRNVEQPMICAPMVSYHSAGSSALVAAFHGAGAAAAGALALGLPAALLRPDSSNVQQSGGGASLNNAVSSESSPTVNAAGGAGGTATVSSVNNNTNSPSSTSNVESNSSATSSSSSTAANNTRQQRRNNHRRH